MRSASASRRILLSLAVVLLIGGPLIAVVAPGSAATIRIDPNGAP
jgi:hypothetical protein